MTDDSTGWRGQKNVIGWLLAAIGGLVAFIGGQIVESLRGLHAEYGALMKEEDTNAQRLTALEQSQKDLTDEVRGDEKRLNDHLDKSK